MFYPYKKGKGEWTNTVPLTQEATPYTPLWSSGDGYQTNNLFIFRVSDQTATTTAAYTGVPIIYNIAIEDKTTWYNTTTGIWTPQVAGWWQLSVGAYNNGASVDENIVSLQGAAYAQADAIGLNSGTCTGFGYFNGTTSNVKVSVSTQQSGSVSHPQTPQTTFFQALYLRP